MNKYGLRLKKIREEKGLTQEELAKELGTSRSRIGMYEQGKRQPDFEMQETIADFFNVTIDYLFGRDIVIDVSDNRKYAEIIRAYSKASPEIQKAVELLLKADQPDS